MAHYAIHVPIDKDMRFFPKYVRKGLSDKEAAYASLIEGMDYYDRIINPSTELWAKTKQQAVRELCSASGILFDPEVVKAFIETVGQL